MVRHVINNPTNHHHPIMSTATSPSPIGLINSTTLLLLLFLLWVTVTSISATDHIVGANRGWNPGINYTLWANNQTFYIGDLISFRYQKAQYNVFEVNQTGYDNCTTEGAVGNWSSGKDFILLTEAQRYYFICGTGRCFNGMKVSVLVHPLPSPPKSAVAPANSAAPAVATVQSLAGLMGLFNFMWLWIAFGWI